MRLLKLLPALALLSASAVAASWDGIHGDLRVYTFAPNAAALPGLPWAASYVTEIFVSSSDASVTAFRVTVTYLDSDRKEQRQSILAPISPNGADSVAAFVGINLKAITAVSITKLRDGETAELR